MSFFNRKMSIETGKFKIYITLISAKCIERKNGRFDTEVKYKVDYIIYDKSIKQLHVNFNIYETTKERKLSTKRLKLINFNETNMITMNDHFTIKDEEYNKDDRWVGPHSIYQISFRVSSKLLLSYTPMAKRSNTVVIDVDCY